MSKFINLDGERFGKLVVIKYVGKDKWNRATWLCKCNCGKETTVQSGNLRSGHTKSCGCLNIDNRKQRSTTHGHYKNGKMSRTYKTWACMIQRCNNPNNTKYPDYGGRGITICNRWKKFYNFLKDMEEVPTGYQIERIDNNGNYCKLNCKWATRKEQARNRRNNHLETYGGKTQCLAIWAEEYNIPYATLQARLDKLNWSIKRALTTPIKRSQQ